MFWFRINLIRNTLKILVCFFRDVGSMVTTFTLHVKNMGSIPVRPINEYAEIGSRVGFRCSLFQIVKVRLFLFVRIKEYDN